MEGRELSEKALVQRLAVNPSRSTTTPWAAFRRTSQPHGVGHKPLRRDTPLGQFVIHPRSCHHEAGSTPCPKMLSASRADTYMSWAMFPLSDIWWNHKNPFPLCLIHFHVSSLTGLGSLGLGSHHPGAHAFGVLGNRKCLGTGQARSPCL